MRHVAAVLCLAFALLFAPAAAFAQAVPDGDKAAVQQVIHDQLESFKQGDAVTAYSFAAPDIRMIFPTPGAFMTMVQKAYPAVAAPKSYNFGPLETKADGLTQSVEILGPDGSYWTAVYTLARQDDGTWKITACFLTKSSGTAA